MNCEPLQIITSQIKISKVKNKTDDVVWVSRSDSLTAISASLSPLFTSDLDASSVDVRSAEDESLQNTVQKLFSKVILKNEREAARNKPSRILFKTLSSTEVMVSALNVPASKADTLSELLEFLLLLSFPVLWTRTSWHAPESSSRLSSPPASTDKCVGVGSSAKWPSWTWKYE